MISIAILNLAGVEKGDALAMPAPRAFTHVHQPLELVISLTSRHVLTFSLVVLVSLSLPPSLTSCIGLSLEFSLLILRIDCS